MKLATRVKLKTAEMLFAGMAGMDRMSSGINMNLFDPALARNPYPHLNELRTRQPVFYSRAFRGWWVTRFDLVQEIREPLYAEP